MTDTPSDALGGLYEETGLFTGPSTSWMITHQDIHLLSLTEPDVIRGNWARICDDLHPMERHYGPEGRTPRPRPQDHYLLIHVGTQQIGLAWTQQPSGTTRAYGFGLFPECRGLGHGVCVKLALIDRCFQEPWVHKVEAEVIGANLWSLHVLHGLDDPMREEGRVRETLRIDGAYYDRVFFGITREEWEARRA